MERKKHSYSSDDWLPPEDEIGLKVVQTLRKPESSVKARGISASKRTDNFNIHLKDRSPIKRPKTDLFVDVIPRRKDISTSSKGYNDKHDVAEARPKASEFTALTKQEQDITSMFTDGEGEGNGDNNNQQPAEDDGDAVELGSQEVVIQSCTDDTTIHGVEDQASHPPEQMGFIDEESAANYRRLLEQSKRTYKNANVRKNRQNQPVQDDSVYSQTSSSSHSSPSAPHTQLLAEKSTMATDTTTSIDGLPDDPLEAVSPTAPNTYSPRSRTRPLHRLHQRPHISDSETTNEEMEFLDQGIVIKKRLRTRPAVSAARNRVEQARRSMNQHSYESDSDFESTPKDSGRQQIREFVDDTENVSLLQDMPETDSESERKQSSTVLVIHGSSDEDGDFVSNPDDLPESYGSSSGLAPQKAALDTFWSAFDKRRRPQLKHRHRLSKSVEVSEEAPIKFVKGYSEELDDDLADFIVDDDEHDESGLEKHIDRSSDNIDAVNNKPRDDHSVRPMSGSDGLHGLMTLMPDEFSQLDLPTSFKIYTQYLVYWICNDRHKPVFNDENTRYFYLAYIAVTRVIDSLEQSVIASSAWVEDFCNALYRHPDYTSRGIMSIPGCEACHFRQNRTATFYVEFFGTPYSRSMLAPPQPGETQISDDVLEDKIKDSEEASVVSVDSDNLSQPQNISFNVGRICKKRSTTCHELHHYCYHLSLKIDIALKPLLADVDSSEIIDPDDLVSILDKQGTIDNLFDGYKSMLSRAKSEFVS